MNIFLFNLFIIFVHQIYCDDSGYGQDDYKKEPESPFSMTVSVQKEDVYLKKDPNQMVIQLGDSGGGNKKDYGSGGGYKKKPKKYRPQYKKTDYNVYEGYGGGGGYAPQSYGNNNYENSGYGGGYATEAYSSGSSGYGSYAPGSYGYEAPGYVSHDYGVADVGGGYGGGAGYGAQPLNLYENSYKGFDNYGGNGGYGNYAPQEYSKGYGYRRLGFAPKKMVPKANQKMSPKRYPKQYQKQYPKPYPRTKPQRDNRDLKMASDMIDKQYIYALNNHRFFN